MRGRFRAQVTRRITAGHLPFGQASHGDGMTELHESRWRRLKTWITAGPTHGAPREDLIPILSLLRHDLTESEIVHVAAVLASEWSRHKQPITDDDIRRIVNEHIYQTTDDSDVMAVRAMLSRSEYPLAPATDAVKPSKPHRV